VTDWEQGLWRIGWAAQLAASLEVMADKPGNVSWGRDFGDVRFVDFAASAIAIGPAMQAAPHVPVGVTIWRAVNDTRRFVSTNTNLGVILLLAPLAKAAGHAPFERLQDAVHDVLQSLSVEDARRTYAAIRRSAPGGLGKADRYDVRQGDPGVTLLEAMRVAQHRDVIAREYVTDFALTFETGYPALTRFWAAGYRLRDAVIQTALTLLAQEPDTLIARKEGWQTAEAVSRQAQRVLQAGGAFSDAGRRALRDFDASLRGDRHRLNPGATADLVTASLFLLILREMEDDASLSWPDLIARW